MITFGCEEFFTKSKDGYALPIPGPPGSIVQLWRMQLTQELAALNDILKQCMMSSVQEERANKRRRQLNSILFGDIATIQEDWS